MFVFGVTAAGPLLMTETSAWAATTLMLQLLVPVPGGDVESMALATKEERPATVGVPVIAPVEGLRRTKPGGSDPPVIENV
jgi:hypothetical protein